MLRRNQTSVSRGEPNVMGFSSFSRTAAATWVDSELAWQKQAGISGVAGAQGEAKASGQVQSESWID